MRKKWERMWSAPWKRCALARRAFQGTAGRTGGATLAHRRIQNIESKPPDPVSHFVNPCPGLGSTQRPPQSDLAASGASFVKFCGAPGDSFSSPESLPGAPPERPRGPENRAKKARNRVEEAIRTENCETLKNDDRLKRNAWFCRLEIIEI